MEETLLTLGLGKLVDIVVSFAWVYELVMGDIVDIVLVHEFLVDNPRGIGNNLVYPSTLTNSLASFGVGHGWCVLVVCAELVRDDSDQKLDFGERQFCLTELETVSALSARLVVQKPTEKTDPKWNRSYTPSA
jgi:hypothetical protein